jgi:hypothetical protein
LRGDIALDLLCKNPADSPGHWLAHVANEKEKITTIFAWTNLVLRCMSCIILIHNPDKAKSQGGREVDRQQPDVEDLRLPGVLVEW